MNVIFRCIAGLLILSMNSLAEEPNRWKKPEALMKPMGDSQN